MPEGDCDRRNVREEDGMKTIGKLALSGLATVLPVALTLYVFWWLGAGAETFLGGLLRRVLPESLYVPGAGLALGFLFLVGVGLVMRGVVARRLERLMDRLMARIPLVRTIYGSVGDLLSLFSKKEAGSIERVVLVAPDHSQIRVLGLVTRSAVPELVAGTEGEALAAVYLPMSYGIGGYTVLVPRSALTPVPMSVEQALRFAVTAGAPAKGG
jgi:uncharacterized membrane protein